jgi:hypothetical protein
MAGKKETRTLIHRDADITGQNRSNSLITPAEIGAQNLSTDAQLKFQRRGTMMFMKSALVQQMRMRSQIDRDKDSDSAASRFDRNLKNLQGSFGTGSKQAI